MSIEERTAPFSRSLVLIHMVAFILMVWGMGMAIMPRRAPAWFPGQRIVGTLGIALGAGLVSWTLLHFRAWRFEAKLNRGHELATLGPFRILRHPVYMGLNLLALGTAIWIPSALVWVSVGLMAAFGNRYRDSFAHKKRFLPGVY